MVQYQVSLVAAIKRAFSNYCVFTGRASRSEFWWFFLFAYIVSMILYIPTMNALISVMSEPGFTAADIQAVQASGGVWAYLLSIWSLATLLPNLGLLWRRLHDTGRSGWNWLWAFLPLVGGIVLLVFLCQPSEPIANKYGEVPNEVKS